MRDHSRSTPWLDQLRSKSSFPKIIAHRGDSLRAPENTLEAAELGYKAGAFAWELDVHLTRDGIPVVIHDESLSRTTNVKSLFSNDCRADQNYPVSRFTLAEIKTLDAGAWFLSAEGGSRSCTGFGSKARVPAEIVERCRTGSIKIPTLREALDATMSWDWWVNVEIKSFPNSSDRIVPAVLAEIHQLADRVLISSFDHEDLAEVSRLSPNITTGLLVDQPLLDPYSYLSKAVGADCFHPSSAVLGAESDRYFEAPGASSLRLSQVKRSIENGCPILVYTVNDDGGEGLGRHLAELGVAAFFTDDPERMAARFRAG